MAISPAASNLKATGAVFGGQLGYNWQTGSWVWGVEGAESNRRPSPYMQSERSFQFLAARPSPL